MRHTAVIARQLADNGFVVYRSDLRNHVGLSDGDIEQFTMTQALDGVRVVAEKVMEVEKNEQVLIVAASLSFRLAVRMAAIDKNVSGLIGLVGVVDTRHTLSQAFNDDFFARARGDWPVYAEFERYQIASATFGPDCVDQGWLELADCIHELERIQCGIVNFCGGNDKWVRIDDIRTAFSSNQGARRIVVEMPDVEHELAKNPVAVNELLRDITRYALEVGAGYRNQENEVVDLSFDAMAAQTIFERRQEAAAGSRRVVEAC
jgi:acyl transferase